MTQKNARSAGMTKRGRSDTSLFAAATDRKGGMPAVGNDSLLQDFLNAKRSTKVMIGAALTVVVAILMISLVRSQASLSQKQQELAELEEKIAQQKQDNAEIERLINGDLELYIEDYARDKLDMVKPGERVFINTVGD